MTGVALLLSPCQPLQPGVIPMVPRATIRGDMEEMRSCWTNERARVLHAARTVLLLPKRHSLPRVLVLRPRLRLWGPVPTRSPAVVSFGSSNIPCRLLPGSIRDGAPGTGMSSSSSSSGAGALPA